MPSHGRPESSIRGRLHEVIFESDTRSGRIFDLLLSVCIVASIVVAMLDSLVEVRVQYGRILEQLEWVFTILFTVEYLLRLVAVRHPTGYAWSFYGIVDLLAVIPT